MENASLVTHHPSLLTSLRRIITNLFIAFTGAYGLSVSGFLLLRALFGERYGFIALINSYVHLLMIPAAILFPICLLFRRPRLALTQAAPAMAFFTAYITLFLPRASAAPPETARLALLSYNLNAGNQQIDSIEQIIRDANVDVVALQELNPQIAGQLAARLNDLYPYQALHPQEWFDGQGFFSRYPIVTDEYWQINLGHQRLEIDWNGTPIVVYNTHPTHPLRGLRFAMDTRTAEIRDLLERASRETHPHFLIGDFNMTDQSQDYARVTARYADAYRAVGWGMGFTFPNFKNSRFGIDFLPALARIDYVFHDPNFTPLAARVWSDSGGSDHYPLYVELSLP